MRRRPGPYLRALVSLPALAFIAQPAGADVQDPGSLLIFQEYDNRVGVVTMLTLTNTNPTDGVLVEWLYYSEESCSELNRTDSLTGNDTLTLLTNFHNPELDRGYVLLFAKDELDDAIAFNWLTGTTLVVDGLSLFEYAVNPVSFRGIGDGTYTDLNGDGELDLDGMEYAMGPDELLFPRFLGQGGTIQSELLLIDLSGGADYTASVDILLFNDNEVSFSANHAFECFGRVPLLDVSFAFSNDFLKSTDNDPDEIFGLPELESGWFRIDGDVTASAEGLIEDPLVLGLLVDRVGSRSAAGRPFHLGLQGQGSANEPPVCAPDFAMTTEDLAVDIAVLANDFDPEGMLDCGSLTIVVPPANGTVALNGCVGIECASCVVNYQPNPGFLGVDSFIYQIADAPGATADCDVTIVVEELIEPPDCPQGVSIELWPPNHKFHHLDLDAVAGVTDPNGLSVSIVITAITQDEPVTATGDGNTVCDGDGVGTNVAAIRAERQGGGNGRVYRVSYTATNTDGASCDGSLEVTVPHSQDGPAAVDDGQIYDSTEGC